MLHCIAYSLQGDLQACFNYGARVGAPGLMKLVLGVSQAGEVDPATNDNILFQDASAKGHRSVLEYLVQLSGEKEYNGIDPGANNHAALKLAVQHGRRGVVQYLRDLRDPRDVEKQTRIYTTSDTFAAVYKRNNTSGSFDEVEIFGTESITDRTDFEPFKKEFKSNGVEAIYSTGSAFAAVLKGSGKVLTWGSGKHGAVVATNEDTDALQNGGVEAIYSTHGAFAAVLKGSGQVVAWGNSDYGGRIISDQVKKELSSGEGVEAIYSTHGAFAAVLKGSGLVVAWGNSDYGGSSAIKSKRSSVLGWKPFTQPSLPLPPFSGIRGEW